MARMRKVGDESEGAEVPSGSGGACEQATTAIRPMLIARPPGRGLSVTLFFLALLFDLPFLFGVHRFHERQIRPGEDGDDDEQMHDDREQDNLQPGQRPIQVRDIRAVVLEIEVHQ